MDTFLEQEYMIRAIGKEAVVTDEEVKRFYDANEKGFIHCGASAGKAHPDPGVFGRLWRGEEKGREKIDGEGDESRRARTLQDLPQSFRRIRILR